MSDAPTPPIKVNRDLETARLARLSKILKAKRIPMRTYIAMRVLERHPRMTLVEVGRVIGLSSSAMTKVYRTLVSLGMVEEPEEFTTRHGRDLRLTDKSPMQNIDRQLPNGYWKFEDDPEIR